ncbi:HAD-IA family hydrolase [Paenirhodobacter sp.]|uniref:HAD-IA family hydrolase n=1 Tax=Paenirhodobacter sp. TaxID=1965326 RepID=UPI003B3C3F74
MKDIYLSLAAEAGFAADAFQLACLRWPAFADSAEALARLRAMTNAYCTAFSAYSESLGNPFHDSVTRDDTGCANPEPQFFAFNKRRQLAHRFRQAEILHVPQSQYHDIGIARELGYATCWIVRRSGLAGFGDTASALPEMLDQRSK